MLSIIDIIEWLRREYDTPTGRVTKNVTPSDMVSLVGI